MRRARRQVPLTPEQRVQQRLNAVEGQPAPWRTFRSDTQGPRRVVHGRVAVSAGTLGSGDGGFTVSGLSVGVATITFSQQFATTPTITLTAQAVAGTPVLATLTAQSGTSFTVLLRNLSNVNVDTTFHFIAVGPAN